MQEFLGLEGEDAKTILKRAEAETAELNEEIRRLNLESFERVTAKLDKDSQRKMRELFQGVWSLPDRT
ncbi:MAG: hypothetical protein AAF483_08775 [Planctomycetota bacterium]